MRTRNLFAFATIATLCLMIAPMTAALADDGRCDVRHDRIDIS